MTNFWDFTGGSLATGSTLTRASTGYYQNSSGGLVSAAVNVARFDYSAGTYLGLLYEASSSNKIYYSNDLTQSSQWSVFAGNGGTTPTVSYGATAPDGTSTASTMTLAAFGGGTVYQQAAIDAHWIQSSVPGIITVWLKGASGGETVSIYLGQNFSPYNNLYMANLTLTSGWKQYSLSIPSGTFASDMALFIGQNGSLNGTGGTGSPYNGSSQTFYMWGYQLEIASTATSTIVTSGGSATRSADILNITFPSDGSSQLIIKFDDNSTQTISGLSAGSYNVTTPLNRTHIKTMQTNTYGALPVFNLQGVNLHGVSIR